MQTGNKLLMGHCLAFYSTKVKYVAPVPVSSYKIQFYDKFVAELSKLFDKVKVGLPWEESTQLGSLIYEDQVKKVLSYVELAKEEGARVVAGGVRVTDGEFGKVVS